MGSMSMAIKVDLFGCGIEPQLRQRTFKIKRYQLRVDFKPHESRGDVFDDNFSSSVLDGGDFTIRADEVKMIREQDAFHDLIVVDESQVVKSCVCGILTYLWKKDLSALMMGRFTRMK